MKSYQQLAHDGDNARRKECGWEGQGAWVGIEFPKPRTEAEAKALSLVQQEFPNSCTIHVYTLVDLLTKIFQLEKDDHSA